MMPTLKDVSRKTRTSAQSPAGAAPSVQRTLGEKLRWLVRLILLLTAFSLVTLAIVCPRCLQVELKQGVFNFLFAFAMFGSLWYVNNRLSHVLDARMPWLEHIGKRFLVTMLATLAVSTVVVLLLNLVFLPMRGYTFRDMDSDDWTSMVVSPIVITFLISLFMHSRAFLLDWRQTAINAERLQKESIASQYESLKAQVNPHFLFNSLNVLTSLVETDQKLAVKFIRKLSEVYRYVLDSRQKEVVPLAEELGFLDSYTYLQKIRHGEALQVHNELPIDGNLQVVPMGLQLLLENAIKHNTALDDQPLRIRLYLEGDDLVVQNNLQERRIREEDSTGMGLANLQARYGYLTDKPVQVLRTAETFTVKLPILYLKS